MNQAKTIFNILKGIYMEVLYAFFVIGWACLVCFFVLHLYHR